MAKRGNNEGTIYHREDGRWMGQVTVGYSEAGKQLRKTVYGDTRKEVADKLKALLERARAGTAPASSVTVADWLDRWLETYVRPTVRPKTYESYESTIRLHLKPALGKTKLERLQITQVQELVNSRPSRTGDLCRTVLRAALQQAVREGFAARNVAQFAKRPKTRDIERRALTPAEIEKLIGAAATERLGVMIVVMLGTGLRSGEILALRWSDLDFKRKILKVSQAVSRAKVPGTNTTQVSIQPPKTAAGRRVIPLTDNVMAALRSWRSGQAADRLFFGQEWHETGLVFTYPKGEMVGYRALRDLVKRCADKAGLEGVHPHSLRHTLATNMIGAGADPRKVQEILGHSTVVLTLNVYAQSFDENKAKTLDSIDHLLNPVKIP